MAKKQEETVDPLSVRVRAVLLKFTRHLILIGAIIGLLWVTWIMLFQSDPQRDFDTFEETMEAYTAHVRAYQRSGFILPNPTDIKYFLGFFDRESNQFFEDNYEALARIRLADDMERFESLSSSGLEGEAMMYMLNYPPLGGISQILERRQVDGENREEVTVMTRSGRRSSFSISRMDGQWVMLEFAGALPELEQTISR